MVFPEYRPRRLRKNETFRALIRETRLSASQLIYPLFIMPGKNKREEIPSMPGVFRLSVDQLKKEAEECLKLGIQNVILFGLPEKKDAMGSGAHAKDGIIQRAIKELKNKAPEMMVTTDVCLCEYTDHGHCGCLIGNEVDNDTTLEILAKTALSHAQAGADMVAPSDMMDGRVAEIRAALDENNLEMIPIMSYAVKYASAFYGPFRMPPTAPRNSETAAAIRWTPPTAAKPCVRQRWMSTKGRISSWSNPRLPIWISLPGSKMNSTCPSPPTM